MVVNRWPTAAEAIQKVYLMLEDYVGKYVVGIDIGGTKCAVTLGRYPVGARIDDCIVDKIRFNTLKLGGAQSAVQVIKRAVDSILLRNGVGADRVVGIGVCCGSPLDTGKGVIMSPPNLPGWDGVPIVDIMQAKFNIPTRLQNDANACALAEWQFGASKGCSNAVFLTFGTGLGAGLILDGRLYPGASDMAGELGHVRLADYGPVGYGKEGSFEGFCSGTGIAQLARAKALEQIQRGRRPALCGEKEGLDGISAKRVAELAARGDALSIEVFEACGRMLGKGLAIIIDILNPEIIVLGSIFQRCEALLRPSMEEAIKKEALRPNAAACRVAASELGERLGDFAALSIAAMPFRLDGQGRE